jgi:hypothetical protein
MAVECPHCQQPIPVDGFRLRSWCPNCGRELSTSPRNDPAAEPATTEAPRLRPAEGLPRLAGAAGGKLPYFHVRIASSGPRTAYRIYIAGTDLLFIHLGVQSLDPGHHARQGAAITGGGLIGGLIGSVAAEEARARIARLTRSLDAADERILRRFAAEDEDSFTLATGDLRDLRIEPRSVWQALKRGPGCAALLRFTHPERGDMTLELLAIDDVTAAVRELRRLYGDAVQVKVSWNSL